MDPDLWTVYRKAVQVLISLVVFGTGAAFVGYSFYLPTVGAFNQTNVAFALGFVMMVLGLPTAIVLSSTIRASRAAQAPS